VKLARHFYLDASALAKRYAPEPGTPAINYLFSRAPAHRMFALRLGAAEVVSILVRKRNAKILSRSITSQAFIDLEAEIITQAALRKLDADADLVNAALPLIVQHSINATDAVLLRSALDLAVVLRAGGDDLALVASDHRLLRAAQAEGLLVFNPETQTTADLDQLLL
jgi:predicted nucleic acid-binding protein